MVINTTIIITIFMLIVIIHSTVVIPQYYEYRYYDCDYKQVITLIFYRLTRQQVDIFGNCGRLACPKNDSRRCISLLEKDYFFYLAMENSFDRDYVTEKFSKSLMNGVVPIVFGGADYNR